MSRSRRCFSDTFKADAVRRHLVDTKKSKQRAEDRKERKIAQLEDKLARKNEVISELMEEIVREE